MSSDNAAEQISKNNQRRHNHGSNTLRCPDCKGFLSESQVFETATHIRYTCPKCGTGQKFVPPSKR